MADFRLSLYDRTYCGRSIRKASLLFSGSGFASPGMPTMDRGYGPTHSATPIAAYPPMANDAAPGDTNGQDVGDVWYVVSPTGEPIES